MECRVRWTGGDYGARPILPTISPRRLAGGHQGRPYQSFFLMMDLLEQTLRSLVQFGQDALSGGNVWILMFVGLVGIGIMMAVRGKLTESWLWIPILALAMWYAIYRWLQLR